MHPEEITIALNRFLIWITKSDSTKGIPSIADTAQSSANIKVCLWLIYYFSLCDFILKFLPLEIAVVLRYLPEAVLYLYVFVLLTKEWRVVSFPLFWPLCVCALTMTVSGILNASSILWVMADFRIFFRFAAFSYIGWRTKVTPQRILQFIKGFLGLAIVELVVGGLELTGGSGIQHFFSPILGLISGAPGGAVNQRYGEAGFIFGTMSDYNQFGMFMTLSCILAFALYSIQGLRRYLWLAIFCALAVVFSFSRHSLLMLPLALGYLFLLRRKTVSVTYLFRLGVVALMLLATIVGLVNHFDPDFANRFATISGEQLDLDNPENMRLFLTVELTPRFLKTFPFFGQGPIPPSEKSQFGETDESTGPALKAAQDLPPQATFYLTDVVWVMILGLYGGFGLAAFGFVLWTIASASNRERKRGSNPAYVALAQACMVSIVPFVVSGFFSLEMVTRDTIPVFWTLAGIVLSLAANAESYKHEARNRPQMAAGIA